MRLCKYVIWVAVALGCVHAGAEDALFEDDFREGPAAGWRWIREHREAWRAGEKGLEILVEPGNMWGGANDARNVLARPLPEGAGEQVAVEAIVENAPTHQYEQIDLVWYYDDSNMVKIGLELVDKQLSLVMGREEGDKTRTIAIVPVESTKLHVRFEVDGGKITGKFRTSEGEDWRTAGDCDLPVKGEAKISLQAYQGDPAKAHWARVERVRVLRAEE